MNKHINVILTLIIYCLIFCSSDVYASILDYEVNYVGGTLTAIDSNLSKLSNGSIYFERGTDFTTSSSSSDRDFVIFKVYFNSYYLYTNNYSQDWTDTDTVALTPNVTGTTVAPSSYTGGQIACKIQHNYDSTTAQTTAMSCNYIGKGYTFELENKSHYREHEYDYENIRDTYNISVKFSNGLTNTCDYDNGLLICPYFKNTSVELIQFNVNNSNSNLFYSIKIEPKFGFYNKTSTQQFNQIMNNDSSSFNSGIENIAGNTQLPNNSGLFDVLSNLSQFVGNLSASGSCSPILVPIPFTNDNFRLPCMTTEVYAPNFPELLAIWQLIVRGVVYYYIIVNMLKLLKDTIDPFSMKLEVLDL